MTERRVTRTGKDNDGDITHLCNPGEAWSPRSKTDAIRDIGNRYCTYYVRSTDGRSEIEVVDGQTGKYLRTVRDGKSGNNLDNLPDC